MGHDQRGGVRLWRTDVQKVDLLAVDLGGKLRELIELSLVRQYSANSFK